MNSGGLAGSTDSGSTEVGLRFALNIPLSSIILSSDASEASSVSSQLAPISAAKAKFTAICAQGTAPSEETILARASKLTIKDTSRNSFQVSEPTTTASPGQDVTLHYTGAQTTSSNEYISIIIKNSEGNALYYGTPKKVTTADDTVTFTVPEGLDKGDYTVEVLNEQKNPAKQTNYAGLDTVTLSVPTKKAVVTATEQGRSGLWKVVATEDPDAEALATFEGEGTTQTIAFNVPEGTTQVYVVDYAENISEPITLTKDAASPTKEVTYNEGTITLTITDTGAGIKSIDGAEETPTPTGYPKEVEVNITDKNKTSAIVVDALGNEAKLELDLDNVNPTITKAYKKENKAIIKATDAGGAGLWKAVSSNSLDGGLVCPFEGKVNEQQKIITIEGTAPTEVYAIDHAGNISGAKTLEDDTQAPSGTVTYNNGTITLRVTDYKSGIAKIGTTTYTDYPASVNDYTVTTGTPSVEMVDALGNTATKDIDHTPPTASEKFIRVTGGQGYVTITATDADSKLWKVVATKDKNATALGTFAGNQTETIRFTTSNTSLRTVYLVDKAGNVSDAVALTEDSLAPTVSEAFIRVADGKGNVTITATDDGVGLWKVVASKNADVEALGTFEGEGATKTARFTVADSSLREVYVVDKAGNITDVVRLTEDITPPEATRAFIKVVGEQGKVILTATDDVSGMWKVVDVDDTVLYTYTADDTEKVRFNVTDNTLRKVYLVDKAGNKSAAVELVEDSEKPVLTSGYIR